jgi:hypothetical protein
LDLARSLERTGVMVRGIVQQQVEALAGGAVCEQAHQEALVLVKKPCRFLSRILRRFQCHGEFLTFWCTLIDRAHNQLNLIYIAEIKSDEN